MEILLGLLIIAIGSFGQSSSYVPIKKVKSWAWESFWIVQGIFAWLVFPFLGALLGVPQGMGLFELLGSGGALKSIVYGVLWGVGGLTFGLSMRYLGVALGQSISLGTCAGFGTLLPAIFAGTNLFRGEGLILLVGVCITLAGIAVIGYAGSLRSKNMTEEEKKVRLMELGYSEKSAVELLTPCYGHIGFPSFSLSNNNANINRIKKRLELAKRMKGTPEKEYTINGVRVVENYPENRLQVFFDDIPAKEIRDSLKQHGFRWSRHNSCWQSYMNRRNIDFIKELLEETEA